MENKELMDKLQAYFLDQDPQIIARVCANLMLDMHRLYHIESLNAKEAGCLFMRIEQNALQLKDFAINGPSGPLTIGPLGGEK